jgi:hypothetical protein
MNAWLKRVTREPYPGLSPGGLQGQLLGLEDLRLALAELLRGVEGEVENAVALEDRFSLGVELDRDRGGSPPLSVTDLLPTTTRRVGRGRDFVPGKPVTYSWLSSR